MAYCNQKSHNNHPWQPSISLDLLLLTEDKEMNTIVGHSHLTSSNYQQKDGINSN